MMKKRMKKIINAEILDCISKINGKYRINGWDYSVEQLGAKLVNELENNGFDLVGDEEVLDATYDIQFIEGDDESLSVVFFSFVLTEGDLWESFFEVWQNGDYRIKEVDYDFDD